MKYRVQCLTPVLVGDGASLAPIDYMVWKDQVNVLDQQKIFRLLARGPRLDGYLMQLRKAQKLDFASWGGFAQSYAGRRIALEHPSIARHWEREPSENCHIPTFASDVRGPYLPAAAIRGALRTALLTARQTDASLAGIRELVEGDRPVRRLGQIMEKRTLGDGAGSDPFKAFGISDSGPAARDRFQVFLLRTASLVEQRGGARAYGLGWKRAPRGTSPGNRPMESTPVFAEMAIPGAVFEGDWFEREFYSKGPIRHALGWRRALNGQAMLEAANDAAELLISAHRQFAELAGLGTVAAAVAALEERLAAARERGNACLLSLGWGAGLLSKTVFRDTGVQDARTILRAQPFFAPAIRTGIPFPKTRRIVFREDSPALLPGWVWFEIL